MPRPYRLPRTPRPSRGRVCAGVVCAGLTALATAAPAVAAPTAPTAPRSVQQTRALELQWAAVTPPAYPFTSGTITVGGTYTCTDPVGSTVAVEFNAIQMMPIAGASGAGSLPCGPGVVNAPWEIESYPAWNVHNGYLSVILSADGVVQSKQFNA